jgi:TonB family protein
VASPVLAPALFAETRNQGMGRSELLTQEFTPAVSVETLAMKFPLQELRRGGEGWVTVSYVITPEGTVTNAVVDASSGSPPFERAALEAVSASVYEPALLNDVAVTSSINQRVIKFELNNRTYNSSGSSLRFQRYNTDARNAYLTADWQTFEAALLQIENLEYLNRFEKANYRMLRGLHAEKNDNVGEALEQYKLALNWGAEHLETPSTMLLLQHSFSLMIAEEDFVGAVRFVENIPQALWNEPPVQNILALADRLESQLAEHEYLVNFAEISDGGAWSLPVTRAVVNIQPEEGSTHIVEFRCDASYQRFETIEHASFVIPRSWGECVVRLAGEPGSTASIYQFHQ